MNEYDPRRQSSIDKYAEESVENALNETNQPSDLEKNKDDLATIFARTIDLLADIFGNWAKIAIKPGMTSHTAIWVKGNRKYTFTAEIVNEQSENNATDIKKGL